MAERRRFELSLVTPEGPAFEGEAEMVIVPGDAGEIGVLARHAPLVAMLKAGEIRVKAGDEEIDRWHMEQRLRHAENKVAVAGR